MSFEKARTVHPLPISVMLERSGAGNVPALKMRRGISEIRTPDNELEDSESDISGKQQSKLPDEDVIRSYFERITPSVSSAASTDELAIAPHSIFYTWEKYVIVFLGGFSGFWSSISSPIYLPILPVLQKKFNVTEEQLNVTIVVYSIFQGLSPILFSNLSDKYGRRIIIIICLCIYIAANIGLALNTTYTGLVLLRCLQALGIASTLSVASGIASDITLKSERGSFIGLSTGLSLLGQGFGALIGGIISTSFGWRAIFWFLAISALVTLVIVFLLLPETTRAIVGNGSNLPLHWWSVAPILLLPSFKGRVLKDLGSRTENDDEEFDDSDENTVELDDLSGEEMSKLGDNTRIPPRSFDIMLPFKILRVTPVYMTLIPSSLYYSLWLAMLTSLSISLSKAPYGYSTIKIGIAYIPSGIGGLSGTIISGRLLDWSYRHYTKKNENETSNTTKKMNTIQVRLWNTHVPSVLAIAGSILFGWGIQRELHVSVALIGSFLVSYGAMSFLTISTTVLVDLFPDKSSGSSSCVNLTRCWCAAIFLAALSKMVAAFTMGGCYTFLASLCGFSNLCIFLVIHKSGEESWLKSHTTI